MTTSTAHPDSRDGVLDFMNHALVRGHVEAKIAHVLRRAHQTAEELNKPDEARVILHLAHSFADELADANPRFDRLQFIREVTEDPS